MPLDLQFAVADEIVVLVGVMLIRICLAEVALLSSIHSSTVEVIVTGVNDKFLFFFIENSEVYLLGTEHR